MKLSGKFVVFVLAFTLLLALAYIAHAGMGSGIPAQAAQGGNVVLAGDYSFTVVPVVSWLDSDPGASPSFKGSMRNDQDLETNNDDDLNQFGDDGASNSYEGHADRETDLQAHHWAPDTYGLGGSYGRDSR